MKKQKVLLTIATLILGLTFMLLDGQLFYYGKNYIEFYNYLPFNIRPIDRPKFEGGFKLEDEYGFSLVSNGECQYGLSSEKITVKEVIKYGYKTDELVALIEDINGRKYFIECIKNKDTLLMQEIIFNILDEDSFKDYRTYKWIEIEKDNTVLVLFRNLSISIFIFLFITLMFIYLTKHDSKRSPSR